MDLHSSQHSFLLLAMAYIMQAEKLIMLSACCMQSLYIILHGYLKLLELEETLLHHTSMSTVLISYMADPILTGEIKCYKTTFSSTSGLH